MRVSSKSSSVGGSQSVGSARPVGAATPAGASAAPGAVGDALSVSSTAQFIAVAEAVLAKVPEVREAKVEALRAKLGSDSYHPDGEAVADGLVREYMSPRSRS